MSLDGLSPMRPPAETVDTRCNPPSRLGLGLGLRLGLGLGRVRCPPAETTS